MSAKQSSTAAGQSIPKLRQHHHAFDESVDESAELIEHEPVAIESEAPAEENQPIEGERLEDEAEPAAFEEE